MPVPGIETGKGPGLLVPVVVGNARRTVDRARLAQLKRMSSPKRAVSPKQGFSHEHN